MKAKNWFSLIILILALTLAASCSCGDDDDDDSSSSGNDDDDDSQADDDDNVSGDDDDQSDDDDINLDGYPAQCNLGIDLAEHCGLPVPDTADRSEAKDLCEQGDRLAYIHAYCGLTHPYSCSDMDQCINDLQTNPDPACEGSLLVSGEVNFVGAQGELNWFLVFTGAHNGQTTISLATSQVEGNVTSFSFPFWKCMGTAYISVYNDKNYNGVLDFGELYGDSSEFDIAKQDISGLNF